MKTLARGLVVLLTTSLAAACVTTRAQAPTTRPALEVPPVPPRVIEPAPTPPTPTPEPVADLPAAPTTPPRPRPTARENASREATAKPDPKPPENPVVEPTPAQPTPPATSVPPLRTARTADGAQAERQIRDIIGRANSLLGRVNYQKLTAERRKAYDQAKQFIEGAELGIKEGKFEYALELADKAETLAKELQG